MIRLRTPPKQAALRIVAELGGAAQQSRPAIGGGKPLRARMV
jgi:hypothetical protein